MLRPASAERAEEVQALVERAAAHIQTVGKQQAFADLSRPDGGFVVGELYVFCLAAGGTILAQGGNPKLVGKNLSDFRGADGRQPAVDIVRLGLTEGQGWLQYPWPNPQSGQVQTKVTYVLRIDHRTVCASGYYKPLASP